MKSRSVYGQDEVLAEAEEKGYLYTRNEKLIYEWIAKCKKNDRLCLYTHIDDDNSVMVFRMDTVLLTIPFTCIDAISKLIYRYARRALRLEVNEFGFKLSGIPMYTGRNVCEDILELVRKYSWRDALR